MADQQRKDNRTGRGATPRSHQAPRPPGDRRASEARSGRTGLAPAVFNQAKTISEKSGVPLSWAAKIATGEKSLVEVLAILKLRDQVAGLQTRGELDPPLGKAVIEGRLSLDEALFLTRLRKIKRQESYKKSHLSDFHEIGQPVCLALIGGDLIQGTLVASGAFDVTIRSGEEEPRLVYKHDVKFFFPGQRKKGVLKALQWGPAENRLEPDFLRRISKRKDIKAAALLRCVEDGRTVNWKTAEEDVLRGKLEWFGRYEILLRTSRGDEVYLMRHAALALG